jgi:hypothetical protein
LYAIGDNESPDCHRSASTIPEEFAIAADARTFLVHELQINSGADLTGRYRVESHKKNGTIPRTTLPYSCDFEKLVVGQDFVFITIEAPGSEVCCTKIIYSIPLLRMLFNVC